MNDDKARAALADRIEGSLGPFNFITKEERAIVVAALRQTPDSFRRIYDKMQRGKVSADDANTSNAEPANRSTAKATANVGDDGERMGSEPVKGIVTGGSDPTLCTFSPPERTK